MRRNCYQSLVILSVVLLAASCAKQARTRPLNTTDVNPGAGSMEAVRKQLEGKWTLTSLKVTSADGKQADVDAAGTLLSDAFGVMHVEYRMSAAGQKTLQGLGVTSPNPVISTTGRVVIDTQQHRITYVGDDFEEKAAGFDPKLAAARANPFALERVRYYTFGTDTLTLSTRYDNGKECAVSQWKKES